MLTLFNDVFSGDGLETKRAACHEGGPWPIAHIAVLRREKYKFRGRGATQKHSVSSLGAHVRTLYVNSSGLQGRSGWMNWSSWLKCMMFKPFLKASSMGVSLHFVLEPPHSRKCHSQRDRVKSWSENMAFTSILGRCILRWRERFIGKLKSLWIFPLTLPGL